jgi:hypothetical protein
MIKLKTLLTESEHDLHSVYKLIDNLPAGNIFEDAKRISGIFKKSNHSWSEVIETFERNKDNAQLKNVNVMDICITQPNIQSNKVKRIVSIIGRMPEINAVQFADGEIAIYDGHHRLVANWAIGNQNMQVNLVTLNSDTWNY